MPNKNKYNPSGKPVLTKNSGRKGAFLKSIEQHLKRISNTKKRK